MARNEGDPPATLSVTASLFPVARTITAHPGQSIIVAAGVVIGVYTGEPVKRIEAAPAALPLPAAPAQAAPARRKPGKGQRGPGPVRLEMRERFLAAIRKHGGRLRSVDLTDAIGVKLFGTPRAHNLRSAIQDLAAEGLVEIGGVGGKGKIYTLREPAQAPAAEPAAQAPAGELFQ